jgi:hypothetical protein
MCEIVCEGDVREEGDMKVGVLNRCCVSWVDNYDSFTLYLSVIDVGEEGGSIDMCSRM